MEWNPDGEMKDLLGEIEQWKPAPEPEQFGNAWVIEALKKDCKKLADEAIPQEESRVEGKNKKKNKREKERRKAKAKEKAKEKEKAGEQTEENAETEL
jgi:hypothetical protein